MTAREPLKARGTYVNAAAGRGTSRRWRRGSEVAIVAMSVGLAAGGAVSTVSAASTRAPARSVHAHKSKPKRIAWVIGAAADLTGTGAAEGQAERVGLNYYFKGLDAGGGIHGHKVTVEFCDTQSTTSGGAQCATQLAGVNTHIVLLLGSLPSTQGAATAMTRDLGISIVPVLFPKAGTNIFQEAPLEKLVVAPMIKDALAAHMKTIGVMYTSDASGAGQLGAASAVAAAAGVKIISEPMNPSATDVTPQLVQLQSEGAQLIFSATIGTATTAVLSSYHTLGMRIPIVLGAEAVTNNFLSSVSFPLPPNLYGITPMALGSGFTPAITKAWTLLAKGFKAFVHHPIDSEGTSSNYAGCLAARVLALTNKGSATADEQYLAHHEITCFGATIRYDIPGLNVAAGIPTEMVQAGVKASDGWGATRKAL